MYILKLYIVCAVFITSCPRHLHIPIWRVVRLLLWSTDWPILRSKQPSMYSNLRLKSSKCRCCLTLPYSFNCHFTPNSFFSFLFFCTCPLFVLYSTTTTPRLSSTCTGTVRTRHTFLHHQHQTAAVQSMRPPAPPLQSHHPVKSPRRRKTSQRASLHSR